MIAARLLPGQGLGNQLWLIFAAQAFAKQLNSGFKIFGEQHLKANFRGLTLEAFYDGTPEHHFRRVSENPLLHPTTGENITKYQPDFVNQLRGHVEIEGYFQSERYLHEKKDIQAQLSLEGEFFDGCTVSLRGGEYKGLDRVFLGERYYRNAVAHVKQVYGAGVPIRVVTDDPRLARRWFSDVEIISSGGVIRIPHLPYVHPRKHLVRRDFASLQNSRIIVASNSSFSWWGAYTARNAELVIAPQYWASHNFSDGYWSQGDSLTRDWYWMNRLGELKDFDYCSAELSEFRTKNKWS